MKTKFYITTAIDYVNAEPHIGHAFEKTVADAIARYHRLNGEDVFFLTGVDENAQKNVEAAKKAGIPIKDFVNKNTGLFQELCKKLGISYDDFIRTSAEEHAEIVQEIIKKIIRKKDIYKGKYEGYYCTGCEAFVTEKDLVDGKCPEHNTKPEHRKEDAYFFRLSKYQKQLLDIIPKYIFPNSRRNEILNRVKEGLDDLCISRKGVEWGIDFPGDNKFKIYVWIDALINYISGLKDRKKKYWPADLHVVGKGINWFHSVIWPALLLSAGYDLPKKLLVHGYLVSRGKKISKSLGNAISPLELLKKYNADVLRYSLLKCSTFEDSDFSEEILIERNNNELANKLGNLINRVAALIEKSFGGKIDFAEIDDQLANQLLLDNIKKNIENLEIDKALSLIFAFIDGCNLYIQEKQPWQIKDKKHLKNILYSLTDSIRIISILLSAFLPETSKKINHQFGFKTGNLKDCKFGLLKQANVKKGDVLFKKI